MAKSFKDMSPMQRIEAMRHGGVTLFPNLSKEEKRAVLYVLNEPAVTVQRTDSKVTA
ncbi:hypothetical protein UYSO10_2479 [Kosakonia radicincitans]|uniref:hypothetical protein n=1 Tax=Kosakonia radicincitans TaxID=283686 RepID=UPI0012510E4C|nr:hypothetical protein [Kosakonia radicincitans]VVT48738.1 hypothetical protein UYSO10_2479 [Kosakonia radicincitans]